MITAKLFTNGRSQALRLPKEFRFNGSEVYVQKLGDSLIIVPKDKEWDTFLEGIKGFTDDYFEVLESRDDDLPPERETL